MWAIAGKRGCFCNRAGRRPRRAGPHAYPVEVARSARNVEYTVHAVGSVEAYELVRPRVAGVVERVRFTEGIA